VTLREIDDTVEKVKLKEKILTKEKSQFRWAMLLLLYLQYGL
jgi:hypothetical protein